MKVTKAKCLNTDLATHLLGKSPQFRTTAQFGPFPLGLAPRAAALFEQLEFASVGWEQS
ncbi:MAG: hypothetical protein ABIS28_20185 [Caldimonas sp.]